LPASTQIFGSQEQVRFGCLRHVTIVLRLVRPDRRRPLGEAFVLLRECFGLEIRLLLERLTLRLELALRGDQVADTGDDAADKSVAESPVPRQTKNAAPPACTDGAIIAPRVDQLNG
jgi:hypothetical protein